MCRQRNDLVETVEEERIVGDQERVCPVLGE
jgi:hypothetical protein